MIGVLLIATGGTRYESFVPGIVESLKQFFPPHRVLLFGRHPNPPQGVIQLSVENYNWPRATLMRYHMFWEHRDVLSNYHHLFYMDIDMLAKSPITSEEICGDGITAVLHPGFVYNPIKAYCRDRGSTAFVEGNKEYYQGCFQGGSVDDYLAMCNRIRENVNIDDSNNVIPEWFDEAHLNRYLYDRPPAITLPSTFAYPENIESYPVLHGKEPKILHIQKHGQENWK
jgi:histo-blood group ABO system transferase